MAKRDLSKQLESLTFRCPACGNTFDAAPSRVEDEPCLEHHPFTYFADCTRCGEEAAQAPFHKSLVKAWSKATGPKTAAGKAASARNLEGHPTAEEALRTRFNALKHGMTAETAQYFPARPGQVPGMQQLRRGPRLLRQTAGLHQADPAFHGASRGL
ncbi:zinc ribbon domain-containing protein [Chromobacterium haemolyticum]|nr:zinc ribbon domain-containing protein [Chromobacterium haemolyticum]